MFQLEKHELPNCLKSQNVILNKSDNKRGQHIKKMPYVFTEQGVYMVATILKNDIATQQSIYIMRSFKEMKHYLAENKLLLSSTELSNINNRLDKHEINIDTLSLLKHKQQNVDVTIFTANKGIPKLHRLEVDNFDREYPNLSVKKIRKFHDRYIILNYGTEDEIMYHCGHSSKDTGNKVSTIHKMLDTEVMHPVIDELLENDDFLFR